MDPDRDNRPSQPDSSKPESPATPENKPEITPETQAKPRLNSTVTPAGPVKYVRPPAFFKRLGLMCVRPEEWAESARYPLWTTLLLVLAAVIISAFFYSAGSVGHFYSVCRKFAVDYDKNYPALELSNDGVLTAKGDLKGPIRVVNDRNGVALYVDPSDRTTPESLKDPAVLLITSKNFFLRSGAFEKSTPLKELIADPLLAGVGPSTVPAVVPATVPATSSAVAATGPATAPAAGVFATINGTNLLAVLEVQGVIWAVLVGIFAGILSCISFSLWATIMILICAPLVVMGAGSNRQGLVMPRRIAYRIVAAVTIPLIMADGVLSGLGYPVSDLLTPDWSHTFWMLACAGMAYWAGRLALGIFGPKAVKRGT